MKTFPDGSRLRRYDLPSIDGLEGWATIVLGADGFFAAVSDYGNYAFWWSHFGDGDFREFMIRRPLDPGYVLSKISREEFDLYATVAAVREHIKGLPEDEAERETINVDDLESDGDFSGWCRETGIDDAHEFICESYPANARAFAEKTLTRLAEVLRAEMAAEGQAP